MNRVISPFIDKAGKPVHKGDILWYNESLPYAQSLHVVEKIDGVWVGRTVVGNWNGKYNIVENDTPIALHFYCISHDEFPNKFSDAEVVGNINDNPEYLTVEWATKNYPLQA